MSVLWPWGLASLAAVAAAAFWALRRPTRQIAVVSSLTLWTRALDALGPSAAARSRRLTASWMLLLAGATAAATALSRPVHFTRAPGRHVAVAIYPSAELTGLPDGALQRAVKALLDRFDRRDRIRLVLPTASGRTEELSLDETVLQVSAVKLLPAAAAALSLPQTDSSVQHLYRFAPATLPPEDGPRITTISLPAMPGAVTLDAFAVSELPPAPRPDATTVPAGQAQAFLAVRNHTARPLSGQVLLRRADSPPVVLRYDAAPASRADLVAQLPGAGEYYSVEISGAAGAGSRALLVRRNWPVCRVVMIGRDDPLVRRFVQVHPAVRLAAGLRDADAAIAIGGVPPANTPALVIDPPAPPPGWSSAGALGAVSLRDADLLADHPLLAHANLAGVWIRQSAPWRSGDLPATGRPVVSIGQKALVVAADSPRRVYLAFDTATANTNFPMSESFVIFLANAMRYLLPQAKAEVEYVSRTPLEAGPHRDWSAAGTSPEGTTVEGPPGAGGAPGAAPALGTGPLLAPGLYRDASGSLHALSLTGLKSAPPAEDPLTKIASLALPDPLAQVRTVELAPALALAAVLLWLAGWALRLRP